MYVYIYISYNYIYIYIYAHKTLHLSLLICLLVFIIDVTGNILMDRNNAYNHITIVHSSWWPDGPSMALHGASSSHCVQRTPVIWSTVWGVSERIYVIYVRYVIDVLDELHVIFVIFQHLGTVII